ncbi:MAG: hydroxyacid dehydrogenase, partial [Acidimicrobiia bacterium]|nr:hydroxyacid dehydrogenase [Acidimicrobiia bacterium]
MTAPGIAVEPKSGRYESLEQSVMAGGGRLALVEEADALVWADPAVPHELPSVLARGPGVRWVALPFAGIEPYA